MNTRQTGFTETDSPAILLVQVALTEWNQQQEKLGKLIDALTNVQLAKTIAPGRNSGIWILGHLTAVNDGMFPLFGFRKKLYPKLKELFIDNSDGAALNYPSASALRAYWNAVNNKLNLYFSTMTIEDWIEKHAAVAAEEFKQCPHLNKISMLMKRTQHMAYHAGQLILLKQSF